MFRYAPDLKHKLVKANQEQAKLEGERDFFKQLYKNAITVNQIQDEGNRLTMTYHDT